jgi:hypothetical protein
MDKTKLTSVQNKLVEELDEIIEICYLNYNEIEKENKGDRTTYLEIIKDRYIRTEVIHNYVLIDEILTCFICDYFFGKKKSLIQLWKTKKFQNFNFYISDTLFLLRKLELVDAILKLPKYIKTAIRELNSLRNGFAHSFFPKNRRKNKPIYKKNDIYSIEGFRFFKKDQGNIIDELVKKTKIKL